MDIYVIGDEDTVLGFNLIGAKGTIIENAEEAEREIDQALDRSDTSLLLITREFASTMRERIDQLKMNSLKPVIIEIPGKDLEPPEQSIRNMVRRAIGISV